MKEQIPNAKSEKRVNDPEIAEQMAYIEKPYRESYRFGFLNPSQEKIREGVEKAEEFERKVNPNSSSFDSKAYEQFLRRNQIFKFPKGSLGRNLEEVTLEDQIRLKVSEAEIINRSHLQMENEKKKWLDIRKHSRCIKELFQRQLP